MIAQVSLEGVKSCIRDVTLGLSRLTVITGANSSGKSTALQALLVLKQTAEQPPYDAALRLNGPYGRLGTDRVIGPSGGRIDVEWDNQGKPKGQFGVSLTQRDGAVAVEELRCGGRGPLLRVEATGSERKCIQDNPGELFANERGRVLVRGIFVTHEIRSVAKYTREQESLLVDGCERIVGSHVQDLLVSDVEIVSKEDRLHAQEAQSFLNEGDVANAVAALVQIGSIRADLLEYGEAIGVELWDYVPARFSGVLKTLGAHAPEDRLLRELKSIARDFQRQECELVRIVDDEDGGVDTLLGNILYLGPLRSDPQIVYEDVVVRDPRRMGAKGERCVPLLYYSRNTYVEDVDPETLGKTTMRRRVSLSAALDSWMAYLGVGRSVRVRAESPYGLVVEIESDDTIGGVYLTNVGVGVSQVLPILALCLLARPGSVVILEQPELHLHPAVQSRLADFLIALSGMGRQLIVETHSEHLVNRLRLHIARGGMKKDDARVFFLCLEDGVTQAKEVEVDERGMMGTWPAGFFDESEHVLLEIGRAMAGE